MTRSRNESELSALEAAGYHPGWSLDPYYPDDLQAAQRQVGEWFSIECKSIRPD
jgi:hypothetical protein